MASDHSEKCEQLATKRGTDNRKPLDWVGGTVAVRLLLVIMVFCAISHTLRNAGSTVGIDYYQFWAVGRSIARRESSDIYSTAGRARLGRQFYAEALQSKSAVQRVAAEHRLSFDTTSTPFLYSVFSKLSTDNYQANLRGYRFLLLASFVGSIAGLSYLLRSSSSLALLLVALLCLWFEPLASDLRVGNVSCLQLAGIVIAANLRSKLPKRNRYWASGVWLGLLIAFKPNLVFVALAMSLGLVYYRAWKALAQEGIGMLLGGAIAVGASIWAMRDATVWLSWLNALRQVSDAEIAIDFGNMAAVGLLRGPLGGLAWVAMVGAALTAVVSAWYARLRLQSKPSAVRQKSDPQYEGAANGTRRARSGLRVWGETPRNEEGRGSEAAPRSGDERLKRLSSGGTSQSAAVDDRDNVLWLIAVGSLGLLLVPQLAWLHYFVLAVPALLLVLGELPTRLPAPGPGIAHYLGILAWLGLGFNPFVMLGVSYTVRTFAIVTVIGTYALLCSTLMHYRRPRLPEAYE